MKISQLKFRFIKDYNPCKNSLQIRRVVILLNKLPGVHLSLCGKINKYHYVSTEISKIDVSRFTNYNVNISELKWVRNELRTNEFKGKKTDSLNKSIKNFIDVLSIFIGDYEGKLLVYFIKPPIKPRIPLDENINTRSHLKST